MPNAFAQMMIADFGSSKATTRFLNIAAQGTLGEQPHVRSGDYRADVCSKCFAKHLHALAEKIDGT
jgi:hypothetical protein